MKPKEYDNVAFLIGKAPTLKALDKALDNLPAIIAGHGIDAPVDWLPAILRSHGDLKNGIAIFHHTHRLICKKGVAIELQVHYKSRYGHGLAFFTEMATLLGLHGHIEYPDERSDKTRSRTIVNKTKVNPSKLPELLFDI